MPSWNDGETSTDESLLSEFVGADLSPVSRVPESTYDPDFAGVHAGPERCHHNLPCHRYVAFDGTNTGRRFLGCGCKDQEICETVYWVDQEWTTSLKTALIKVWQLYEEEKDTRISENVEYSTANYQLVLEKRELQKKNLELHKELGNLSMEQESTSAVYIEKVKREKAELQIGTLKEEKKNLEYAVADLLNIGERNKQKMKAISEICASWE